jgi:hypothetical protein
LLVRSSGFILAPLLQEHISQIELGIGIIRLECQRLADQFQRVIDLPLLIRDPTQHVHRLKIAGLGCQYFEIKTPRFLDPTGLVLSQCKIESLLNVDHGLCGAGSIWMAP